MVSIYLKIKILKTKTIELAETDTKLQEPIKSLENYVKHNCELASNTTRVSGKYIRVQTTTGSISYKKFQRKNLLPARKIKPPKVLSPVCPKLNCSCSQNLLKFTTVAPVVKMPKLI